MAQMIFINLPVKDLAASRTFYESIGWTNQPDFTDATAACMKWSETIFAMLLTHEKYKSFTSKDIVDARRSSEVLLCLTSDARSGVDDLVGRAGKAGGKLDPTPIQDFGFMLGRSFEDPDGHIWEVVWMDVAAALAQGDGAKARN